MKQWFTPTINEIHKGFLLSWAYRFNLLGEMLLIGVAFIGLSFLIGQGEIEARDLQATLIGYLIWFYAEIAINHVTWYLREETQTGTLEQLMMSPAPPVLLILARTVSNFLTTSLMVIIMGAMISLLFGLHMPLALSALPIFLLTVIGLFGFTLSIAALTLVYKQIEAFTSFIQTILLFLNGSLIAVSVFPPALELMVKFLPTTLGIIALRQVMLDGMSLGELWRNGGLPILILHTIGSVGVGYLIFKRGERTAKQRGTLGQY